MRCGLDEFGLLLALLGDGQHRVAEGVQGLARLALRGFDHDRLLHHHREIDRRGIEAVIDQALGDVPGVDALRALPLGREDALVHARAVVGDLIRRGQPRADVVRVEDRVVADLGEPSRAQAAQVGVRADEDAEVAVEAVEPPDRLRTVMVEEEPGAVALDRRRGQVGGQRRLDPDGARPGPSAAVRGRERLVEVEVDDVEPHVARPHQAEQRVQVGAVHVEERARVVDDLRDLDNLFLEEPERVGVGEHQRGAVVVDQFREVAHVDQALGVGMNGLNLVPRQRGGGRVGAVRRIGDDDAPAGVATRRVVGVDHQDARELALRAGGGLQRHAIHARHFLQPLFEFIHQTQRALRERLALQGVRGRRARVPRHLLVDLGVVLHRARPQWIKAAVHAVVLAGEARVVPNDVHLAELGERGCRRASRGLRHGGCGRCGDIQGRQAIASAAGGAFLEQQRFRHCLPPIPPPTDRSPHASAFPSRTPTRGWPTRDRALPGRARP